MRRELACLQFKSQLLQVYEEQGIIPAFYAYLGFLKSFTMNSRYTQFTDWQIEDMLMCVYNPVIDPWVQTLEIALDYTRRGGKSRALTLIAEFYSLLDKVVVWRSPHTDQLVQCAEWFSMNPFTSSNKVRTQSIVKVFGSPDISVAVLSEGRVASRDANILIYDEGGTVMNWEILYEWYKNSRPMIAASPYKVIIHASTDCENSVFNEILIALRQKEYEYNTNFISIHPWRHCPWITEEWIESEKKNHLDCSWYIDQNYNCIPVVRGGRVFTKIIKVGDELGPRNLDNTLKYPYGCLDAMVATHGGVDFNGINIGHYLINIAFDTENIFVLEEINFHDLWKLFDYDEISLEVEDELFNDQFTEQLKRMGLSCIYQPWKDTVKQIRVQEVSEYNIIIDQYKCPIVYKNLKQAGFDPLTRLPKLAKRTDQHGLDGLLHAKHDVTGKIYVRSKPKSPLLGGRVFFNPLMNM